MRDTDYATFRTKREADTWLRDRERHGNPDHSDRTVIPIADVPEDRCRRAVALGHRWAMRWTYTVDRLRIPGLNA